MFSKPVPTLPEPILPRSRSTVTQHESLDTGKSKGQSAECLAFQECFADLTDAAVSGTLNPGQLAVQLYCKKLIGSELRTEAQKQAVEERVKIEMLLSAVEGQIVASPTTKFREFLDILQNEPSLQHLATKLANAYHEMCTSSVSPFTSTPFSQQLTTCTHPCPPLPTSSPQHLPSNSCLPLPPAKRPKIDPVLQCQYSLKHTVQPPDIQQDHRTCSQARFLQCTTPCCQLFAFDTYASYLKSAYTREKLPIYDKWPLVKSKKYINLALIEKEDITKPEADHFTRATIHGNIDDIKKSKRAMNIAQIAKLPDKSWSRCILVEGAPGVGKSTFAWKLCHKWGKGKLLQQYQLVVLLRLRDKSMRTAKNISNLFRYHDHQIQQAAVEEIQRSGGKGVLLLFEGYDELPEELRTENSIFLDIITGEELPEATVLITSRPWASEFLHRECKRYISQHIEILGFTKANIQSYLESTTANDLSLLAGLKKYMSCYPHINSLMYNPLNSAIVVEVYRNSRKDETLVPKTMTELYSSLVRSLLLRYLLDHPVHGQYRRWRIRRFDDLPEDVHQQLRKLGKMAYEGILHGQQVIFSDLPEDFETLGLMRSAPELYTDEGTAVSYNFLHLTVQEYLAAFYLSLQPVEEQTEHYRKYCSDGDKQANHHLQMVLQFLSGIRKFSGYLSKVLNTLCVEKYFLTVIREVTLQWLFEAQDNEIFDKVLGSGDILICTSYPRELTPFNCFVLGYCVSHSNGTWWVNNHIEHELVEWLMRGTVEEETHCTGGIFAMTLRGSKMTSEGLKHLLNIPKQFIRKLETLDLDWETMDSGACATLGNLIPHVPHLKHLSFLGHDIGQGEAVSLVTSLKTLNSFESLHMTRFGVEDCRAVSGLLSSPTSHLKRLFIDGLIPEAIELIISGLCHNTTLERLEMMNSPLSPQNTVSLASVLKKNHTLIELSLPFCYIDSDGACQLASALCTNNTLQRLDLWSNPPIGVKGAIKFAEMLKRNHGLIHFSLGDCNIDSDGARQLASGLCTNNTLQRLVLWYNPLIGVKGAIKFAEMLKRNHGLIHFSLGDCNIDSDGARQLASALNRNNTLQELHLSPNPIGVKGAIEFAEMLLKNKSLKVLNLIDDSIGEEGTRSLVDSLIHNTTIIELHLPKKYRLLIDSRVGSRVRIL